MPQRWSLQDPYGVDFSNATVAVTENGVPQSVEILSNDANGYGGNAVVWDMPNAPAPQPGEHVIYTVQVDNVESAGQSQSFSYTTTSFDPSTTTELESVTAQFQFLQPTAHVSPSGSSIVIEVSRGMNADQQVSVQYATADGTAHAGTNYVASIGTLTFAPRQFYRQFVVPILTGDAQDSAGTFSISLRSPTGAIIGPVGSVHVSINGAPFSPPAQSPGAGDGGPPAGQIGTILPAEVSIQDIFGTIRVGRTQNTRRAENRLLGFRLTFNEGLAPSRPRCRVNNSPLLGYGSSGFPSQPILCKQVSNRQIYKVSDFLDGPHLGRWLEDNRPCWREAAQIAAAVADALTHARARFQADRGRLADSRRGVEGLGDHVDPGAGGVQSAHPARSSVRRLTDRPVRMARDPPLRGSRRSMEVGKEEPLRNREPSSEEYAIQRTLTTFCGRLYIAVFG
jgi:hypothetical protein